jgi:hypothetical protein
LTSTSDEPANLVALPHNLHSRITHMLRRGEDVSATLTPFLFFRLMCLMRNRRAEEKQEPVRFRQILMQKSYLR